MATLMYTLTVIISILIILELAEDLLVDSTYILTGPKDEGKDIPIEDIIFIDVPKLCEFQPATPLSCGDPSYRIWKGEFWYGRLDYDSTSCTSWSFGLLNCWIDASDDLNNFLFGNPNIIASSFSHLTYGGIDPCWGVWKYLTGTFVCATMDHF